jgi:NitT/TauT family transport system ATP-binding protein
VPPLIVVDQVAKVFTSGARTVTALESVSFDILTANFVSIVGPSGCGKSTLLKILSGLLPASSGKASVSGKPVTGPLENVGMVFQAPVLLKWRSVLGNILLPVEFAKLDLPSHVEKARALIKLVGLAGFEDMYPHELSGGMQQRVSLCRALVTDPQLLLMDEPFGALDAQTRTLMQEELIKLARKIPRTVLFITHAVEEAVYLADRVVVMTRRPGKIAEIVDVAPVRAAGGWDKLTRVEEVMEQAPFTELKSRIWRLLREQQVNLERREHA